MNKDFDTYSLSSQNEGESSASDSQISWEYQKAQINLQNIKTSSGQETYGGKLKETPIVSQIRPSNKNASVQTLYSEDGDGSIFIETDQYTSTKVLVTYIDISTLYKEKRAKSIVLAKKYAILSHLNLIDVSKLFVTKKTLYFEMEAPENTGSWKSFCKRKFTTKDILIIFRQICSALAHLHANNLVHRDVHPTRIHFLNGFAKFNHIGMPYNYKKLLKKENFSGHINYSAPELILENPNFDEKVDIWSLGCWLYYFYTKSDPFEGKTPVIIKKKILNEKIYKGRSDIDPIIIELLDECLVVDSKDRPNGYKLLDILNDLEQKYYNESISGVLSNYNKSEAGKYTIYGAPQPNYKVYSNNFLPPASLKNKRSNNYRNFWQTKVKLSNASDEKIQIDCLPIATTNKSEPSKSPDPKPNTFLASTEGNTESVILEHSQSESKSKWKDHAYFDDDYEYNYSWINKKYLLESISSSDYDSRKGSELSTSSNQESMLIFPDNLVKLEDLSKKLSNSIGSTEQIDKYHCVESSGSMFVGKAIKHGTGVLFYIDPETKIQLKYKGEFKHDLRDGYGEQSFKGGANYFGFWEQDKPHGKGKLVLNDNSVFNGRFTNGVLNKDNMLIEISGSNLRITNYKDIDLQVIGSNSEQHASVLPNHEHINENLNDCFTLSSQKV